MKIGELEKAAGEAVATIHYWMREGLIDVFGTRRSGYQPYNKSMIRRCSVIQQLKKQRLTLKEISERLREIR